MLYTGLRTVCSLHLKHLCLISCSNAIWLLCHHNRSRLMSSGHQTQRILLRQLLTKDRILFMVVTMVLHVSAPYIRTALTTVLKILTLFYKERTLDFQMLSSWRKVTLALSIPALTFASITPCVSTTLPIYLKCSTSSIASFPGMTETVLVELSLSVLLFPLWIFIQRRSECSVTIFAFCCCVWDSWSKSSAKSRTSSFDWDVHRISFLFGDVDCFIVLSIARRNRKGDSRQPCLTPVHTVKASTSLSLCTTLHVNRAYFVRVLGDVGNIFKYSVVP